MFKFKIVDRATYDNLVNICDKVLAKNDELLFTASKILEFNEELIDFNKNLLDLNRLGIKQDVMQRNYEKRIESQGE